MHRLVHRLVSAAAAAIALLGSPAALAQTATGPLITGTWSLNVPATGYDEKSAMSCRGTSTCTGQYTETVRPEGCSGYGIFSGDLTITGLDLSKSGSISGTFTGRGPNWDDGTCVFSNKPTATKSYSYTGTWDLATQTGTLVLVTGSPDFPTQQIAIKAETIAPAVSTSGLFTAALDANGQVYAWGSDTDGQLGQGRQTFQSSPVRVSGLPAMQHIAVYDQVLAVDTGGQVWAWGDLYCPHLGPRDNANVAKPGRLIGVTGMTRVAAGYCQSFALKADGTVWKLMATGAVMLAFPSNIVDISTNGSHVLALRSDGTVHAYGNNAYGQLGVGNTTTTNTVVQVPGLTNVTAISAGYNSSMALLSTGEIRVWGQIAGTSVTSPTAQTGLGGNAIAIAAYDYVFAAVRADGTVWKWGGATTLTSPTQVSSFSGAARVALTPSGAVSYFTIGSGGALSAFGGNNYGQLGQGNTSGPGVVVAVPGFASGTSQVRTTGWNAPSASVVALKSDGSVWFWGKNGSGQSGDGASLGSTVPLTVPIAATIRSIKAGDKFAVALDATGRLWAWGQSANSMIDSSQAHSQPSPKQVEGVSNVAVVAAGGLSLVAYAKTDGTAWELGSGSNTQVAGLANIVGVAASFSNRFYLRADGVLFGIGANPNGELGNGTTVASFTTPVQVTGITGSVRKVVASLLRICAMTTDGRVYMWGADSSGVSLTGGTNIPVLVSGISDAADIEASSRGVLVRRADGSLLALGTTSLADADGRDTSVPYPVAFHEAVQAMALGQPAGLGQVTGYLVGKTGMLWGWGYNKLGWNQTVVGDGTYITRRRPVVVLAAGGSGSIDANNWYLDLQPASAETVPATAIPGANTTAQVSGGTSSLSLSATVMYRAADLGKPVNNFVLGLVPSQFLSFVKSAPDASAMAKLEAKAKANGGLVFVQLTPAGWTDVKGQLLAYSQGVANAAGGASNILSGIDTTLIPGARFCIGYGETANAMLSAQALREILAIEGTATTVANLPCVISGLYTTGPSSSRSATPVTFRASVVGLGPTGAVQFKDGSTNLQSAASLAAANTAVSNAEVTTSSLAVGPHAIGASYAGDSQNAATSVEVPMSHEVVIAQPGASATTLSGPASSATGSTAILVATIAGDSPTGTVQFKDGATNLGSAVALVGAVATLRIDSLAQGSHSITASYAGDSKNAASASSALAHTVYSSITTTIALSSSASSVAAGSSVTLTATVAGSSPSGNVTFRDGATALGTAALSGGTASLAVSTLQAGLHAITVEYAGDAANQAVSSTAVFVQVTVATTSTFEANVKAIVTGYYQTILGRAPDAAGLDYWAAEAARVAGLGADVREVFFAMAIAFFASPEYVGRNTSDAQYITDLYRTFFVRDPDAAGLSYWQGELTAVTSREALLNSFLFSAEFSSQMTSRFGTTSVRPEVNMTIDLFRGTLGRLPDSGGFTYWLGQIRVAQCGGAAAVSSKVNEVAGLFFNSGEYLSRSRSDRDFMGDVYNAYLRRGPGGDSGGFGFWVGQIATLGRDGVRGQFVPSAEFQSRVTAVVAAGCLQ